MSSLNLKDVYKNTVVQAMQEKFNYLNVMMMPKLAKVTINMGLGKAIKDNKLIDRAKADLTLIAGQVPMITHAKKSISTFKLRAGMPIGCKVTLRGDRMYNFLDRLLYVALPRSRDFRGISKKQFDGNGNYSFGIPDYTIFWEVGEGDLGFSIGMDVNIVTTTNVDEEAIYMLSLMMFPFDK